MKNGKSETVEMLSMKNEKEKNKPKETSWANDQLE